MADHGWPSGKAKLSASRSWSRARASERRPSENRVIRSRIRSITAERASKRWKGKGMDDPYLLALFFVPSLKGGGKILKRVELKFLEFFLEKMRRGGVVYPLPLLNPFYGVVATEDK